MLSRKKPLKAKRGFKAPSSSLARSKFKSKPKPLPKKSSSDLSLLIDVLVRIFSKYIRLRHADYRGIVRCFTCDTPGHWTEMHNGHFMPRKERGTSFSEIGCQVQCPTCNTATDNGNRKIFAMRLDNQYGKGTAEQLEFESKQVMRYDRQWYADKIEHYVAEVKRLERK